MTRRIDRGTYQRMYGPTTGDRIRLADTNLVAEVERDDVSYGDEPLWGAGKTIRDSMGMSSHRAQDSTMDLIIANVVVMDPVLGIVKTNIGVTGGRIAAIGRAGNPDITDDVELVAGANTGWIMGEGMIATPGIVDPHVHLATTSLIPAALSAGTTTIVGMGYGHVSDLGVNPEYHFHRMMEAWEGVPMNVGPAGTRQRLRPPRPGAEHGDGLRRPEDPRGLGQLHVRHRQGPHGRRRVRRPGVRAHGLQPGGRGAGGHRRRRRRPDHPRLPHRGPRRRAPQHPGTGRGSGDPRLVHHPDHPVLGEHLPRIPGDAARGAPHALRPGRGPRVPRLAGAGEHRGSRVAPA